MADPHTMSCSTCETSAGAPYPFCPECGRLSPSFVSKGSFAVEIQEVPSEKLSDDLVSLIRSWFPGVDHLEAKNRLKSGRTLLLAGIDEESAVRILDTLKAMKAPGRLVRDDTGQGWGKRLWNPGLAITASAWLLALIIGGIAGIVLAVSGMAAPLAWAFLRGTAGSPLISVLPREPEEDLVRLSSEYSSVMELVSEKEKRTLRELTTAVFDVQQRLQSESLASVAAGAQTGRLFAGLSDAVRTAVDIARRIPSADEEEKRGLREELRSMGDLVTNTNNWFRSIEGQGIKQPQALSEELQEIAASIDRILDDVRRPGGDYGRRREKTLE